VLLTTEADWILTQKNGQYQLKNQKPTQSAPADTRHDRPKNRLLDPTAAWLHALQISSAKGEILPAAQDKWRQINKYLEIIDGLLRDSPLPSDAVIADMGSGKGYLTFALYDYLTNHLQHTPQIVGIELRPQLVEFCNQLAQKSGFSRLHFIAQDIADYQPERLDMLIALHACDTATDLAIAAGIRQKAQWIVTAPCCHKQIRREMQAQNELAPLLHHGILLERQAELVTDGIRALLLEAHHYKITANARPHPSAARRAEALQQVEALKKGFGIGAHFLEGLV
jgi:SAM-dependent methyltransferase